jgi:hypothetical protein
MRKFIRIAIAAAVSAFLISLPAVAQAGVTFNGID